MLCRPWREMVWSEKLILDASSNRMLICSCQIFGGFSVCQNLEYDWQVKKTILGDVECRADCLGQSWKTFQRYLRALNAGCLTTWAAVGDCAVRSRPVKLTMAFHDDADANTDLWRGGGGLGLSGGSSGAASVTRIRGCSSRGRYLPRWVRLGVSWTRWVRRSRWSRKARWSRWQNFCFLLSKQSAPNQDSCVSLLPPHHTFTALNMSLFIWPRRSKVRKVSKQSTSNAEINIKYNKYVIKKNFCEVKENSFHIRWKLMQIIKIHFTSSNAKMTGGLYTKLCQWVPFWTKKFLLI